MDLSKALTRETQARELATRILLLWQGIDTILSPMIGRRGLAALYQRSLLIVSLEYPELSAIKFENLAPAEYAFVEHAFSQQDPAWAKRANASFIQVFNSMLVDLIGAPLAQQLMSSNVVYVEIVQGRSDA